MKIQKILIPIDYTDCAFNALDYAAEVATKFKAHLLILHALDIEETATKTTTEALKSQHIEDINEIINNIPTAVNLMTDIMISEKNPRSAIRNAADTFDVDLIVMGTEGVDNILDEVMGSLTATVINEVACPVLTVPDGCRFQPIHKIGFGADYKVTQRMDSMGLLLQFAYTFGSEVEIFHIRSKDKRKPILAQHEADKLDKVLNGVVHTFDEIEDDNLEGGVNQYIKKANPDLLALMMRKHSFLYLLTHHSATRQLVHHVKLPMLIFAGE